MRIKDLERLVDNIYNKLKSLPKPKPYETGGEYYGSTQLFRVHGNDLEMWKNVQGKFGMFTCRNAYLVQIGGAYDYEDYKQELDELRDTFEMIGNDIFKSIKIGKKTIRYIYIPMVVIIHSMVLTSLNKEKDI